MYPSGEEPTEGVWREDWGLRQVQSREGVTFKQTSDVAVRNKLCVTASRLTEALANVGRDRG